MAACEIGLASRLIGRESVLKTALARVQDNFDVILLDCPPSLGMLTINALMAARWVIIPTQPTPKDLRGLRLFLNTLDDIAPANPSLGVLGVLFTKFDPRLILHRRALETIEAASLPVFRAKIGNSVRVAESEEQCQSIFVYAPDNPRVAEYRELTTEVLECLSLVAVS